MSKRKSYDAIRAELIEMARIDQEMRNAATAGGKWDSSVDKRHTAWLKEIIEEIGWPLVSQVGTEAPQSAWLIAQHADLDVPFQEACLKLMKQLPPEEFKPSSLAYLEDRVRVNTGRKQLYGTQFFGKGNDFGPRPIEDARDVDERRRAVGLGTLDEYREQMEQFRAASSVEAGGKMLNR